MEGSAHYRINGVDCEVGDGNLVYVQSGSMREATTTGMLCAAFDFELLRGTLSLPVITPFVQTEELTRLIREFSYEWLQKNPGRELRCTALFQLILHALLYTGQNADANFHVERMKRYIVEHYTEPIRIRDLALREGLNPVYCGALFREKQGVSVAEYANRIRIQSAKSLLQEGVHTVTEVADMCGFGDVYYFSNTFKRLAGVTPSQYKARAAGRNPKPELLHLLGD
ncbi:AraC family transcriptional regulator [Ruminococcaceae bacterium OttesenSCG-928-L11]|nr:AraC family transcriptional regulator [Ruminococcaceae bacterium OttesenSCG-928-L11]